MVKIVYYFDVRAILVAKGDTKEKKTRITALCENVTAYDIIVFTPTTVNIVMIFFLFDELRFGRPAVMKLKYF
jgi:hypothetical protein